MQYYQSLFPKVDCGDLQDLDYGKVEHEGANAGAKATYTCDYGYKLFGEYERTCQYNGYWSGDEPKCKKSKLDEL